MLKNIVILLLEIFCCSLCWEQNIPVYPVAYPSSHCEGSLSSIRIDGLWHTSNPICQATDGYLGAASDFQTDQQCVPPQSIACNLSGGPTNSPWVDVKYHVRCGGINEQCEIKTFMLNPAHANSVCRVFADPNGYPFEQTYSSGCTCD